MDLLQGTLPSPPPRTQFLTPSTEYIPTLYALYNDYYTPYAAYLAPLRSILYYSQSYFFTYLYPALYPLYRLFAILVNHALASDEKSATSIGALVLLGGIALLSLKLMDMLRRQVIYWISVAVKLGIYASIVGIGVYVYNRGLDQSIDDFTWLLQFLGELGQEGERIGQQKGKQRMGQARSAGSGPKGRTRGAGW
jgi:hypothetical protein